MTILDLDSASLPDIATFGKLGQNMRLKGGKPRIDVVIIWTLCLIWQPNVATAG